MDTKQIKTIAVEKLFGQYDYKLTLPNVVIDDNVFVLYGDNGTGKSTILRLTYHLLCSELGKSHKTYMANVAFKLFYVEFNDGTKISAERSEDTEELIGGYAIKYEKGDEEISTEMPCDWNEDSHRYTISFSSSLTDSKKNFYQILHRLREINVYYIPDNRNTDNREPLEFRHRRQFSSSDPVENEMIQLKEWIISQALEASKKGEEGTSTVYSKILSKLGSRKTKDQKPMTVETMTEEIDNLEKRSKSYAQMGFIPESNYDDIKTKLLKVSKKNIEAAGNILQPYLEIQKRRLDALDNLFDTVIFLTQSLNDYLYKKQVVYFLHEGFRFYQQDKDTPIKIDPRNEIKVRNLSSGERQLLSIFSMVIRMSNSCPIIIIDEPEISLNIKWQRRLLSTLNYFVRGSKAQFVVATHSFEILSSHSENTVKVGESYLPKEDE